MFLEHVVAERQNAKVERYSDRSKPKTTISCGSLFSILELKGFPQELTEGLEKLDLFEKLEQRQKEGEGEDEDENEEKEEPEDDDFSDDDYYKHSDFDDDEDEYNMEDDADVY
ncbi:hypothetical protein DVH24_006838 [Malus domestica]|uniref:DNA-directed RNA polymerase III subunit n=1 Tax=Malus domestica TaxID=3750 RepID=A0A498JAQ3_MALDO|nr:hypothetical protein DVH24_006838 [Malus domestica]